MKKIIKEIKQLIKDNKLKEAQTLFKCHTEEIKRYTEQQQYISIKGHLYQGFNKFILYITKEPGTYGTFKQWIQEKRKVKKGEHGTKIAVPIFEDKENQVIKFIKQVTIFHKNQTETI